MDRRNYMELLSGQIRYKKALPLITRELEAHIEEQKTDFMAQGMTEREAEEMAVREMGDPVEVGVMMDRVHRPKMNWRLIIGIGLISLFGVGLLYALDTGISQKDMPFLYAASHLLYMTVGYVVMIGVCYLDYTWIAHRAKWLLAAYMILLFMGNVFFGTTVNGASGFLNLFGMTVNGNRLTLLLVPLYCAILYSYCGQGYQGLIKGMLWMVPVAAAQLMFRTAEFVILIPVWIVILSVAVYKGYFRVQVKRTFAVIWGVALSLSGAGIFMILKAGSQYQAARLKIMLAPSRYAAEEGYQFHALKKLLEGSRIIGKGADFSEYSGTLPDNSSFALSYVMAYFGVLAAVCVISVIAILLLKMTAMTFRQKNHLGLLMGAGCGAAVAVQAAWYILTNMGIVFIGPVYCPFITNGGCSMVVTYILFGIMLSIYRYQNVATSL